MPTIVSIKESVQNLLRQANIVRAPISVPKIASQVGISLTQAALDDNISGFLFRDEVSKKCIIAINENHPPTRKRFSAAHELGHFVLKHPGKFYINRTAINFRDSVSSTGEDQLEKEANAFAAELLMPEAFLRQDLHDSLVSLNDITAIQNLAADYKVSAEAMTYRLTNLDLIL